MTRVLVIYASKHGHTSKIAGRIALDLRAAGADADVHAVDTRGAEHLGDYDAVVVGTSVHAGHHQRGILDWVRHHAHTLNRMPSALFSVSLSAADDTPEACASAQKYVDDFLDETGWDPRLRVSFAGALQYLEYDFLTRLLMRLLMSRGGHPTDTTRDYDYTDWDAVSAFAAEIGAIAAEVSRA